MRIDIRWLGAAVCGLAILSGCRNEPTLSPSPGATGTAVPPTITATALPRNQQLATRRAEFLSTQNAERQATAQVVTPTPAATVIPTATEVPPTASPSAPLSSEGPWLLFLTSDQGSEDRWLYAMNADGSGLTRVLHEPALTFAARPDSSTEFAEIAVVTQNGLGVLELKIMNLPEGSTRVITPLTRSASETPPDFDPEALTAIARDDSLAWSPDGRYLAFVAAIWGPSADVYVYDFERGEMRQLSSGPEQAYGLEWSPDGEMILYRSTYSVGPDPNPPSVLGIWAISTEGGDPVDLSVMDDPVDPEWHWEHIYGWGGPRVVLLGSQRQGALFNLRVVDLETGEPIMIGDCCYSEAAYAPRYNAWLLNPNDSPEQSLMVINGEAAQLPPRSFESAQWEPALDAFLLTAPNGDVFAVTTAGDIRGLFSDPGWGVYPVPAPIPSPDRAWWLWHSYESETPDSELWIGAPGETPRLITGEALAREVIWAPDGQRFFFLGNALYIASAPDFAPQLVARNLSARPWQMWEAVWIP